DAFLKILNSKLKITTIIQSKNKLIAMKLAKKIIPLVILVAFTFASQSCNKGVGCPSDFSMNQTSTSVVE
ncbi:MAG: hypothetical protein AB8G86_03540, partial [Saprospiraceae bacterium]